jgi:DNA-binding CsgD family transcriptional regulator/GAF domain-containing protein
VARRPSDTELLLEVVGEAYGFECLEDFRLNVLELLTRLVPCDYAGYNEISPDSIYAVTIPAIDPDLESQFAAHAYEHPLIDHYSRTRDGRPYRISDLVDRESFHRLAVYQQFFRLIRCEYQVAFTLPSVPPLIIGLALNREHRDFSEREVNLLALVRPHIMRAYRNAELHGARVALLAALEKGLDTIGRHTIVLDSQDRVEFATDGARRLLGVAGDSLHLRAELRDWLSSRDRDPVARPMILSGAQGEVIVRMLPNRRDDPRRVLLVEAGSGELTTEALWALGLTMREAETLRAVALGHTPDQAATELSVSRRTVDKHLQHIYAKLGAPTLLHAVEAAWAAVGVPRALLEPAPPGRQATSPF